MTTVLGGYVYIKYATERPKTGASNELYITCQHAGNSFKFKHNMSRGSFSWHILPTYIVVRRSVGLYAPVQHAGARVRGCQGGVSRCARG